jgi:hypothetical protein
MAYKDFYYVDSIYAKPQKEITLTENKLIFKSQNGDKNKLKIEKEITKTEEIQKEIDSLLSDFLKFLKQSGTTSYSLGEGPDNVSVMTFTTYYAKIRSIEMTIKFDNKNDKKKLAQKISKILRENSKKAS